MRLLILTFSILLLSSCWMTHEEGISKTKECDALWRYSNMDRFGNISCGALKPDKVQTCIASYIDAIDEKYNNPDTVSDLREDDYSTVVKACNETFWTPKQ